MKKEELKNPLILITFTLIGLYIVGNLNVVGNILKMVLNILFPFILGAFIAFILNIPMEFFSKKLKNIKNKKLVRFLSLLLSLVVVLLIFLIVITLIVPELINVSNLLIENMPYYTERLNNLINNTGLNINNLNIDTEALKEQIINQLPNLLTFSISLVSNVVKFISNFFIAIIFAIYILLDKEKLQRQTKMLLSAYLNKRKSDKIMYISKTMERIFKRFFTIQCLEATILGTLCILGMLILRLPHALPIGILIGVTALIPVMGAFIGVGIGAILIISINPMQALIFIIFILVLQQIEGNIIYPRVVGKSVGLPGIWVLAAVIIGGSLGGIIGMLLGVPIATTLYTLLKTDANNKIALKKEND